jgi:hypothetical protein
MDNYLPKNQQFKINDTVFLSKGPNSKKIKITKILSINETKNTIQSKRY